MLNHLGEMLAALGSWLQPVQGNGWNHLHSGCCEEGQVIPSRQRRGCSPRVGLDRVLHVGAQSAPESPPFQGPRGSHGKRRVRASLWDALARCLLCPLRAPAALEVPAGGWFGRGKASLPRVLLLLSWALQGLPHPTSFPVSTRQGGQPFPRKSPT